MTGQSAMQFPQCGRITSIAAAWMATLNPPEATRPLPSRTAAIEWAEPDMTRLAPVESGASVTDALR